MIESGRQCPGNKLLIANDARKLIVPSFLIQTLGCKLNQLESESISDAFRRAGFIESKTGNPEAKSEKQSYPSIIIINTCTVTSKADQKARRVIRKALRDYPESCVIVTGCYAKLNKDDIQKLEMDGKRRFFVLNKDKIISLPQYLKGKSGINEIINNYVNSLSLKIPDSSSVTRNSFQFNPGKFSQHTRSFLKIQDGCDKQCTYCKIRLVRGPNISLKKDEVLSRLRILEENYAEAVLTGVNICQYMDCEREKGTKIEFAGLLEYLLEGTEKIAIRLSSLSPQSVDENLTRVLPHPRIRPHFHLSVQSGSSKILERMGRSYNSETVEKAVSLLRSAKDDPFIACDIITGFPGETENDFDQTLKLCKNLDFAWCHVFPYSKRSGTLSSSFSDAVSKNEVTRRVHLLTCLAKQGKASYVQRWIGREVDALIENLGRGNHELSSNNMKFSEFNDIIQGTTDNYLKILIRYKGEDTILPGTTLRCKISESGDFKKFDVFADFF